jgi:hypothetical protein
MTVRENPTRQRDDEAQLILCRLEALLDRIEARLAILEGQDR